MWARNSAIRHEAGVRVRKLISIFHSFINYFLFYLFWFLRCLACVYINISVSIRDTSVVFFARSVDGEPRRDRAASSSSPPPLIASRVAPGRRVLPPRRGTSRFPEGNFHRDSIRIVADLVGTLVYFVMVPRSRFFVSCYSSFRWIWARNA